MSYSKYMPFVLLCFVLVITGVIFFWPIMNALNYGGTIMAASIIQIIIDQENRGHTNISGLKLLDNLTLKQPQVSPLPKPEKLPSPYYPSFVEDLWTAVTPHTQAWRTAHYEDRQYTYGGRSIVIFVFHDHRNRKPNLSLIINDLNVCVKKPQWFQFGHFKEKPNEINLCFALVFQIPNTIKDIPTKVYLSTHTNCTTELSAVMPVYQQRQSKKIEFAVCAYKALFNIKTSNLVNIVSWIELNRLFGAESITFYYYSVEQEVKDVIQKYVQEGLVEAIDWKINISLKYVRDLGQLGTTNDCFYRYRNRAKYIAFHDIDELLVPHKYDTWHEMIKEIDKLNSKRTQFLFYNSYWHDTNRTIKDSFNSTSCPHRLPIHFSSISRTTNPVKRGPHKNMVKTDGAVRIGIHTLYKMAKGYHIYPVPVTVGFMHHYRILDHFPKESQREDLTMKRFFGNVMKGIRQKLC